ncbi:MAG TPA: MFS transporter [Candidatus Limnocylindrales bacterium]|nr:MFS transporter [Candidatus Limnocylindrales bacterium]
MQLPFFYGWLIVAIAMVAGFVSSGVSNVMMAVVLKPISEDLGWSRTVTAAAITLGSFAGGLLSPLFGPVADRFGPRILLPLGGVLVGLLSIGVSLSSRPWQFYATFVPARALTEFLLCGVVPYTAIANWFHLKRPRAMGLVAMSTPLGSAAMTLIYQFLVINYGWRSAFLVLGSAFLILVVVPGAIFLRRQPEDLGMFPDGIAPTFASDAVSGRDARTANSHEPNWSRAEAMRTSTLWLLVASVLLASLGTGGIAFHMVAYFTDVNIAPAAAAGAFSAMALSGALGNGVWGSIAEHFSARGLSVATTVLSAASVALLMQVDSPPLAYLFGMLFGISARGGTAVLTQILLAHYFGRRSFGAISGVLEPFHKGGLGIGALVAGVAFDLFGDYRTVFSGFLSMYLLSALLIFWARPPERGSD